MQKLEYPSIGETLYRDTLPNGLRLSVVTKPGYTRCFAFFATNYGGADRRFRLGGEYIDTPMGVAHFLEHKMFDIPTGTTRFPRGPPPAPSPTPTPPPASRHIILNPPRISTKISGCC